MAINRSRWRPLIRPTVSTARREETGGGGAGAARDRLRDPGTARGAVVAMRVAQMRGLGFYDTTVRTSM